MLSEGNRRSLLRAIPFVLLFVWAAGEMHDVATRKAFNLDEFQWGHAAWAVAQGQVPYRDFFDVHFPFAYQFHSLVFTFGAGDDPTVLMTMRKVMAAVLIFLGLCMWRLNASFGKGGAWWGALAGVLAFTLAPFVIWATEIRHDPLAFTFVAASLTALYLKRPRVEARAFVAGICLALACWSTQKVFIYGCVFFGALIADLIVLRRKEKREFLLGDPKWFLAGAGLVVLVILTDLLLKGSLDEFYEWCIAYPVRYQVKEPAQNWFKSFYKMMDEMWWYLALAGVGFRASIQAIRSEGLTVPAELILLTLWPSTLCSWAFQQAAWPYSAVPFLAMTCIFAARGAQTIMTSLSPVTTDDDNAEALSSAPLRSVAAQIPLALLFLLAMNRAGARLDYETEVLDRFDINKRADRYFDEEEQNLQGMPDSAANITVSWPLSGVPLPKDPIARSAAQKARTDAKEIRVLEDEDLLEAAKLDPNFINRRGWDALTHDPVWLDFDEPQVEYQMRTLAKIGELTSTQDAIFDGAGAYVTRPHAFSMFYTYRSIVRDDADMLAREIPLALRYNQAAMVVVEKAKSRTAPGAAARFVKTHYQPYNGDLLIAGFALRASGKRKFTPAGGKLDVLKPGSYFVAPEGFLRNHSLRIDGQPVQGASFELTAGEHVVEVRGKAGDFSLLWLPRNAERWHPNKGHKPRFCCRKIE